MEESNRIGKTVSVNTTNVSFVGVGGQGILLTANMLARAAMIAGMDVKKSEIHGMSQRGGSVMASVRFGEKVFSPIICEGETDILVAFERLEALRCGGALAKDGVLLLNNTDIVPVTVTGGLQPPVTDLEARLEREFPKRLIVEAQKLAEEVGNARTMNMVIAGALSTLVPFKEEHWMRALEESFTGPKAKLLELNRKAFLLGRN